MTLFHHFFPRYSLCAKIYATSDTSFEDVTLKFFALRDKEPLREYLQAVLQNLQASAVNENDEFDRLLQFVFV